MKENSERRLGYRSMYQRQTSFIRVANLIGVTGDSKDLPRVRITSL
jgi:hypothetical protein